MGASGISETVVGYFVERTAREDNVAIEVVGLQQTETFPIHCAADVAESRKAFWMIAARVENAFFFGCVCVPKTTAFI